MTEDSTLRIQLEAVSLNGLAEAAEALLGDDPAAVTGVLADWERQGLGELPRLTGWCWAALAPAGGGRPAGPAPRTLDGLLAGVPSPPRTAVAAAQECRARAERLPPPPTRPSGPEHVLDELWRRALIVAVVNYWTNVAGIAAAARPALVAGDHAGTARALGLGSDELREAGERIGMLARRAAASEPEAEPAAEPEPPPSASGGSRRRRFHRWAPVVFLGLTTVLALGVLYAVLQR